MITSQRTAKVEVPIWMIQFIDHQEVEEKVEEEVEERFENIITTCMESHLQFVFKIKYFWGIFSEQV